MTNNRESFIDNKEFEINFIKEKVIKLLKDKGKLNDYKEILITKISENLFAVTSETKNISFYVNKNGEIILNTFNISNSTNFQYYSSLIGIEEIKNENGEYEMFKIKEGGKRIQIEIYTLEYFKIWEKLLFLIGRDSILDTLEGNSKNKDEIIDDKYLVSMINKGVIRLIDLTIFLSKGNLTYDQYNKYHLSVMNLLLEQIGDERFGLLPNNKEFNITTKQGVFTINTGKVTKDEVNYLLSAKLISPEIHKLAIEKINELKKLEADKQQEVKKDFNDLESEIKGR